MASKTSKKSARSDEQDGFTLLTLGTQREEKCVPQGHETVHGKDLPLLAAPSTAVSSLLGGKSYVFRMTRSSSVSTNGSGVILLTVQTGVLSNYLQSTQITALFSEFRYIKSKITWYRYDLTSPASNEVQALVVGYDPVSIGATPSLTDIIRSPNSKTFNCATTTPTLVTLRHTQRPKRPFSQIATSATTTDPLGQAGAWNYATLVAGPVSRSIVAYLLETWIECRSTR
jgi:hypothetical protein